MKHNLHTFANDRSLADCAMESESRAAACLDAQREHKQRTGDENGTRDVEGYRVLLASLRTRAVNLDDRCKNAKQTVQSSTNTIARAAERCRECLGSVAVKHTVHDAGRT